MSFKLGNTNIGELYVGSNKIAQAYLGSNLVYQAKAPGPTPSFDEVTIGTQTWMAKNLAIDDGGEGIIIVDNVTANGVNFGKQYYYTFDAAVRVANSIIGWHLPSKEEWNTFSDYISSNVNSIKSTTGWNSGNNGNNSTGFNAYPTGWYVDERTSKYIGTLVAYLSSTDSSSTYIYCMRLRYDNSKMSVTTLPKSYLYSVRLIKDT